MVQIAAFTYYLVLAFSDVDVVHILVELRVKSFDLVGNFDLT